MNRLFYDEIIKLIDTVPDVLLKEQLRMLANNYVMMHKGVRQITMVIEDGSCDTDTLQYQGYDIIVYRQGSNIPLIEGVNDGPKRI